MLYHASSQLLLDEAPVDGYDSLGELRAPEGRVVEARGVLVASLLNEVRHWRHANVGHSATYCLWRGRIRGHL